MDLLDNRESSKKEKKGNDHVENKSSQDILGNVLEKYIVLAMLSNKIQSLNKVLLNVTILILDDLIDDNFYKFPDLDRRSMINHNQIQITQNLRIDLLLLNSPPDLLLKYFCHPLNRIVFLQKVVWICSIVVQILNIELTL